tara:strand:+ start:2027 stop:2224 length:198 start_codon:yes stop_codon:yes gene_type:complete
MKTKNLSSYTTEEIKAQLEEKQGLLKRMKFDHAISPIENPSKIRMARKEIARMLTELKSRSLSKA